MILDASSLVRGCLKIYQCLTCLRLLCRRNVRREEVISELSRLPGVSRRLAALLFDEHLVEGQDDLRRRLGGPTIPTAIRTFPLQVGFPSDSKGHRFVSSSPRCSANPSIGEEIAPVYRVEPDLVKYFPTAEARARIVHSEAFSAPVDTVEFDEWQQQLLGVQSTLRCMHDVVPILKKQAKSETRFTEHVDATSGTWADNAVPVPVVSLGGGIFNKHGKVNPLKVLISLLPGWLESENMPLAIEKGLQSVGEGVGDREMAWIQGQWDHLGKLYQEIKQELKHNIISELIRQHLVEEVLSNTCTNVSCAAGRLPWRPETYRLVNHRHCQIACVHYRLSWDTSSSGL